MSSTKLVPETRLMTEDQLSADDAWHTLRRHGGWCLLRDAFIRFRYGDGFSHSRALALQLCLAVVPFLIALTGLITDLGVDEGGKVVADTVLAITPGQSEAMVQDLLTDSERTEDAGELALTLGLLTGLVALTTTMAQIERGANRIYGVERDRPALAKYLRAAVLAVVAGVPALAGFLILVGGRAMGESVRRHYEWGDVAMAGWDVIRWPLSLGLTVLAVAVLFRHAPRRRQPGLSWLFFGASIAIAIWWLASLLLAAYVKYSGGFGQTYGALTGMMALLLWANLTGIALFGGLAFAAQLEAMRIGVEEPAQPDLWEPEAQRAELFDTGEMTSL
ncbi:YihY/virulence factor BrkB family protein [Micromonospora aurantiaca]|uniref:YihY/virulence factor BrkB family protein n=1 Tax=Micromonospora aurantiaca (nom. illeg.) TaxID=47850 RepID=A0A1C6SUC7_9ACTN|nr:MULTISPECIES: YihY/virulence factor BrkB family protein [Micromonospora]ADL45257.1 ribonuclease BN [Micromonospora aurantiaca ATCC 27029]ADU07490.1 ribonuclease BN [Micromonospora sp. L5]AXH91380.1 YihY/virulence factor BrkB family protein [Micromonospora aurantiaca]KAB1108180.1 YihY/virulence factor BrkB family protein [Micromonospora aurantiaca]MBC9004014.1 YihY/virulence factor BrkB family protein [Micromonospora aurantiaca]